MQTKKFLYIFKREKKKEKLKSTSEIEKIAYEINFLCFFFTSFRRKHLSIIRKLIIKWQLKLIETF